MPPAFRVTAGSLGPPASVDRGYRDSVRAVRPVAVAWAGPRRGGAVTLIFAFLWFGLLGLASSAAMSSPMGMVARASFLVFFSVFGAAGVLVTYTGLAFAFNRTVYKITARTLSVAHRPIPLPGVSLPIERIRELAVVREEVPDDGRMETIYHVRARTLVGKDVALWKGATNEVEAVFIARALAEQLGVGLALP
jgi:hypothetical protein